MRAIGFDFNYQNPIAFCLCGALAGRPKTHPEHWFQGLPWPRSPRARWRPTLGRLEVRSSSRVSSEDASVLATRHSHPNLC